MSITSERKWSLLGFEPFELNDKEVFYPLPGLYETYETAMEGARVAVATIEPRQPNLGRLRDRVFIVNPGGGREYYE